MTLKLFKFKSVQSTNNTAIKYIKSGKYTSGVIFSDRQTKGKGTMGKKWISKKGNIFVTFFFQVKISKIKIQNFLKINAYILKNVLKKYTHEPIKLKKPNDLLIDVKKVSGILQELVYHNEKEYLVTGIGVNTNTKVSDNDFKSTNLTKNSKKKINNLKLILELKTKYEKLIFKLDNENYSFLKNLNRI